MSGSISREDDRIEFKPLLAENKRSDWSEAMKQYQAQIITAFDIPPYMLGMTDTDYHASVQQELLKCLKQFQQENIDG